MKKKKETFFFGCCLILNHLIQMYDGKNNSSVSNFFLWQLFRRLQIESNEKNAILFTQVVDKRYFCPTTKSQFLQKKIFHFLFWTIKIATHWRKWPSKSSPLAILKLTAHQIIRSSAAQLSTPVWCVWF